MKKAIRIMLCLAVVLITAVCVCACDDTIQQQEEEYEYIGCVFSVSNILDKDDPTYYVLEMKYDFELSGRITVSMQFISNGQLGFQVKKGYYNIPKDGSVIYIKYDDLDTIIPLGYYDTYIETSKARFQLAGANHLGEFECRAVYNYYGCDYRYGRIEKSTSSQYIKKGSEITATAVPKQGFRFVRWSDGVATATRVDRNIQAEINVTAEFELEPTTFIFPCNDGEIIANYNDDQLVWNPSMQLYESHLGIDFMSADLNVFASGSGIVKEVGYNGLHGNYIVFMHGEGYETIYMSLETASNLEVGAYVRQGQLLGKMSTTQGTEVHKGVHLHFEILRNGEQINPLSVLIFEDK